VAREDELTNLKVRLELTDASEDALLLVLLNDSEQAVLRRLFPFGSPDYEALDDYTDKVVEIAIYKYNRRGGEGEISRAEYGISVSYESGDVPFSYLKSIKPYAGVPHERC